MTFGVRMTGSYPRGKYVLRSESQVIAGARTDCDNRMVLQSTHLLYTIRARKCKRNYHVDRVILGPFHRSGWERKGAWLRCGIDNNDSQLNWPGGEGGGARLSARHCIGWSDGSVSMPRI